MRKKVIKEREKIKVIIYGLDVQGFFIFLKIYYFFFRLDKLDFLDQRFKYDLELWVILFIYIQVIKNFYKQISQVVRFISDKYIKQEKFEE